MINERIYNLLSNPELIKNEDKALIELQINENLYFYPLRYLLLDTLLDKESLEYKSALELASIHTPNRKHLFDFVNKELEIIGTNVSYSTQTLKEVNILKIDVDIPEEINVIKVKELESKFSNETANKIEAEEIEVEEINNFEELKENTNAFDSKNFATENKLEKPIVIQDAEFSFFDWLNLGKKDNNDAKEKKPIFSKRKIEELEGFLADIKANKKKSNKQKKNKTIDSLATETLAELYIKQKKYNKAIKTYEDLMLKYPQKSSLFANLIKEIKSKSHDGI